jgi:hypothetical protein
MKQTGPTTLTVQYTECWMLKQVVRIVTILVLKSKPTALFVPSKLKLACAQPLLQGRTQDMKISSSKHFFNHNAR